MAGAACATVISQGVSVVLCFVYALKKCEFLIFRKSELKWDRSLLADLTSTGLSMGLMYAIVSVSSVILQGAVNSFGTSTITAHTAARKIDDIFMLPLGTISMASSTFASQNYGAGKIDRVDGLITKEALRQQTEYYDKEISKLSEQLAASQDQNALIKTQIDAIKAYVENVNKTASADTNSTEVYGEMLKKVVVLENQTADFYLTCIPFGFRIKYHIKKFNQQHRFNVFIDSCEVIE